MRPEGVQVRVLLIALGLGLALAVPAAAFTMAAFDAKAVGVADGDTLTVLRERTPLRIRLQGIDAPERGQPFGTRARQFTAEAAFGKVVQARRGRRGRWGPPGPGAAPRASSP